MRGNILNNIEGDGSMKKNKGIKIILGVILFIIIGSAGMVIEHFEGDPFVVETVTQDDGAEYIDNGASGKMADGRLNINTATQEELTMLDGIGQKTAQKIIEYRTEHGGFGVIEDLAMVKGISLDMVQKMSDKICVK